MGYTNAGKSTLFNKLTDANVLAEDLLFATLDPTMREVRLPSGRSVILSDTVGFVSDLPTTLIAAFRATLEEVISADIIVHIRDIAHPDTNAQKADVLNVMSELGINLDENRRSIEILNKADLLNQDELHAIENHVARTNDTILMSALTGVNKVQFLEQLDQQLSVDRGVHKFQIHHSDGATVSWLYQNADVLNRDDEGEHIELEVAISSEQLARFEKNTLLDKFFKQQLKCRGTATIYLALAGETASD